MASTPSAPPPAFQTPPPRNRTQATTTSAANRATATTRISPPRPSSAAPLNARKTLNFADSASAAASVAPPARPPRHNRTKSLQPSMASLEELHPELARCSREVLMEMVARQKTELAEALQKADELDEGRSDLVNESSLLMRDLESCRGKIDELMNDQGRMEEELAGRIEVLDKLRSTVRDLEREKRDAAKRYREQAESFDSERQSWYDQEQHYKLRISNLSATSRRSRGVLSDLPKTEKNSSDSESEEPRPSRSSTTSPPPSLRSSTASPSPSTGPSAAELALQDQLASLTTAHTSLTTTLRALQVEMGDLKRVYQDLQEENESYEILLGEKTLNGEVRGSDLFRRSFQWGESGEDGPGANGLGFLGGLEAVGEEDDYFSDDDDEDDGYETGEEDVEKILLETQGTGSPNEGAVASAGVSSGRRTSKSVGAKKRPSGGLDLAAELEAAQLGNDTEEEEAEKKRVAKLERRRASQARRASVADAGRRGSITTTGSVEELRAEVKQLREANKALTLYVSKIVDRVCSQEGFEKVLAVDYRNATPKSAGHSPNPPAADAEAAADTIKFRPASLFRSTNATPSPATRDVGPRDTTPVTPTMASPGGAGRKGLGWDSFSSVFANALSRSNTVGSNNSTPTSAERHASGSSSKALRLGSIGSVHSETGSVARKLSVEEDEDDIRERERLRAEMAQLGIESPTLGNQWGNKAARTSQDSFSRPSSTFQESDGDGTSPTSNDAASPLSPKDLDADAQLVLKSVETQEQEAKAEMGQGRASGFTDPPKRRRPGSMRSSTSSSSHTRNGSTVGLGISDPMSSPPDGSPTPSSLGASPRFESPAGSPLVPGEAQEGEEQPTWGKALRRLSKSWASPPIG